MIANKIFQVSLLAFVCLVSVAALAQDKHFIYLQSDNSQPFYVKSEGKITSSTASGYVILSKLDQGEYTLNIGFPKDLYPEQSFRVRIADHNEGYLLRKSESGWSLLNLESMALVESVKTEDVPMTTSQPTENVSDNAESQSLAGKDTKEEQTPARSVNTFTDLLATVVKDSSILRDNTILKAPIADTVNQVAVSEIKPPVDIKEDQPEQVHEILSEKEKEVQEKAPPVANNPFVRILKVNEVDGQDMVYVNKETRDTIRLFVRGDVSVAETDSVAKIIYKPLEAQADSLQADQQAKIIYEPEARDTARLTITPVIVEVPADTVVGAKVVKDTDLGKTAQILYKTEDPVADTAMEITDPVAVKTSIHNSDCVSLADEKDFLKLRRRMAGENENTKMLDVARRFFRQKCYTTEQVRNLSYLFLDEDGKYRFFDAAYPYVSDPDMFYKLEPLLKDLYFINRFRAMIRK